MDQDRTAQDFPAGLARRTIIGRLLLTLLFISAQAWAALEIVAQVRMDGAGAAAIAIAQSGSCLAMWAEYRQARPLLSRRDRAPFA